MSQLARAVLGYSVEALLRRDYQLADRIVDNAANIRQLEDDVIAVVEEEMGRDPASIKLAIGDIRRTAEYTSDIAEAAMNETIEVIEKHGVGHDKE
ncbi:MAG TPA: PhoU domain-containing protein [Nitrososphaera sp.]|nr:PhoU domain-containing protein [Nitrososphaera sp.]